MRPSFAGGDLDAVQRAIRDFGFDGWLLYDFRGSNEPARRILGIDETRVTSRRFFCFIPASGPLQQIVHRIESGVLDHLPGERHVYLSWQELEEALRTVLSGRSRVAMEYSPGGANPYVAHVDAGTVELVRSCGCTVGSSGDLIAQFDATLTDEQFAAHLAATEITCAAFESAWRLIADGIHRSGGVEECAVQEHILETFSDHGLITDHPPIVAVNENSGDPHYETGSGRHTRITKNCSVLIDQWGRHDHANGIYSDLTRCGWTGPTIPQRYAEVFRIVAAARDAGIACVRSALAAGEVLQGWQVDDAVRSVIEKAGFGAAFCHRTGHSLGRDTHGSGTHIDNLETHETRRILPGSLFTIEPGIYLPEFGIRSEINVFVHADRQVQVTGGPLQEEPVRIGRNL